mmetsp:Transcript_19407/g.9011  ORF Transcript_19407/g.9011 Transcript_19407/m.9011 type:complete len:83 (-) Transcript_19407:683-931(-)
MLQRANIVFCTLSGAGSSELLQINHGFDFVLIDEACQSVELSSLIPLQHNALHVVLIGDPQQLPATLLSTACSRTNYSRSLF